MKLQCKKNVVLQHWYTLFDHYLYLEDHKKLIHFIPQLLEVLTSISALNTLTEYAQNIDLSDISSKLLCTIIEIFNQNKRYDFVAELKKRTYWSFIKMPEYYIMSEAR